MLELLTGAISGVVSGTGMGGGTILILVLSVFLGIDQHRAQATNLIFFIPTSISAIIGVTKEKLINWRVAIPVSIVGMITAYIGAKISIKMSVTMLKKFFGIFLAIIAILEIYNFIKKYIKNKTANNKH